MTPLRLVLVTRRFWPLVGGAERVMASLASRFVALGHQVTLLTAQWHPNWPTELRVGEVPVVRLANPSQRALGTARYMIALARWLRQRQGEIDLVYVSMLKHDAYAALFALEGRVPVVLRAEGAGPTGDSAWHKQANCGPRIRRRTMNANALIAPSRSVDDELRQAGYPPDRLHYIPNGVAIPRPRTAQMQRDARLALSAAHPSLRLPTDGPLAVYTGRLHPGKGLDVLVTAWRQIANQWPDARLWLAGEGPSRDALEQQIHQLGLDGRVVPAGSFDHVEELLWAADLYVLPSLEEAMSVALLEAMAAGLPIVTTDIPGNRPLIVHQEHGLLVPPGDASALAAAMARLVEQPLLAQRLGRAAREQATASFSLDRVVDRHLELFEGLRARFSPHRQA